MTNSPLSRRHLRRQPHLHTARWTAARRPTRFTSSTRSFRRFHIPRQHSSCHPLLLRPDACRRSYPHTPLRLPAATTRTLPPSSPMPRQDLRRHRIHLHHVHTWRTFQEAYLRYNRNNTSTSPQAHGMRTSTGWPATSTHFSHSIQSPKCRCADMILAERGLPFSSDCDPYSNCVHIHTIPPWYSPL